MSKQGKGGTSFCNTAGMSLPTYVKELPISLLNLRPILVIFVTRRLCTDGQLGMFRSMQN